MSGPFVDTPRDPMVNLQDPMRKSGPDRQLELFRQFAKLATGFSNEEVLGALQNMQVNAYRQGYAQLRHAMNALEERQVKTKEMLATHYDQMGKRRNVFSFHQVVEMPLLDARNKT